MDIVLWVIAGVLAAAFLAAGVMKVSQPKARLATRGLAWVEDFSDGQVRVIGALEALAAVGLILPAVTGIAPVLVPLAAVGLVLMMLGAAVTHVRRNEVPLVAVNALLLALAAVVAWGRFGDHSF